MSWNVREELSHAHTSLHTPQTPHTRPAFQKMHVPCVLEDEMTFNLHVRTSVALPETPVTEQTMTDFLAAHGYIIPWDGPETEFDDGKVFWDATVCRPHDMNTTFHLVVFSDEETLHIEARWISHLTDTSEGYTFAAVSECYAFAKTLVQDAHAFFAAL